MPRFTFLLSLTIAFPVMAWEAEIQVDEKIIPAELIDGYQAINYTVESDCPPLSVNRDRDNIVAAWVRAQAAQEQGLTLTEDQAARIKELEDKLTSERSENDTEYKNKQHWLILRNKSDYYWKNTSNNVTDQDINAEHERLVAENDSRFVNAPFFKRVDMSRNNIEYLQQLADQLRSGKNWSQVSEDVDQYDWNFHTKDVWVSFDRIDRNESKSFDALKINQHDLQPNDVIGPLAEQKYYRLLVILDKATVDIVPLNMKINDTNNWASKVISDDLYRKRKNELNAKLLENVKVTQDGELVEIAVEHERCPSE